MQATQLPIPSWEGIKVKEFICMPIGHLNYKFSCTFKFSVGSWWTAELAALTGNIWEHLTLSEKTVKARQDACARAQDGV